MPAKEYDFIPFDYNGQNHDHTHWDKIEKDLKLGYDRIAQNGDWKTAYYELSQVTVSYPFIQAYMDIALGFIANYIATNYDS